MPRIQLLRYFHLVRSTDQESENMKAVYSASFHHAVNKCAKNAALLLVVTFAFPFTWHAYLSLPYKRFLPRVHSCPHALNRVHTQLFSPHSYTQTQPHTCLQIYGSLQAGGSKLGWQYYEWQHSCLGKWTKVGQDTVPPLRWCWYNGLNLDSGGRDRCCPLGGGVRQRSTAKHSCFF